MPIVKSGGQFRVLEDPGRPSSPAPLADTGIVPSWWYSYGDPQLYAALYRTQPEVRTVIDFLARNIAQIGIHVFRRVSDTDRVRLADHQLVDWLRAPNPATTQYRLIESLMNDLGIYFNAYWLKVRLPDRIALVRLPPEQMFPEGWLMPSAFVWTNFYDGTQTRIAPQDVVYFSGFDPLNPLMGLSPLETLRVTLFEDMAATDYRAAFWRNAARLEGVIERPKDAPKWNDAQKQMFREQWQARFTGQPGQTVLLEDGMTFRPMTQTARDAEFIAARKLTREECASAYHVPLPMVGILEHATFSNVKEQHKQLYQDTLGPWLRCIQDELMRQLLPDCDDTENVYVEFNISEKLRGSFEEQAAAIQALVGRPVMTANEGRARLNLPAITDDPTADELAQPLNTASAGIPAGTPRNTDLAPPDPDSPNVDASAVIRRAWTRQRAVLEKLPPAARAGAFDHERWHGELAADLKAAFRAAGRDAPTAGREAAAVAFRVNADTVHLLMDGRAAFSSTRDEGQYV